MNSGRAKAGLACSLALHNAHGTPRPNGNREFSFALLNATAIRKNWLTEMTRRLLGLRAPVKPYEVSTSFSAPELFVRVKCDVHPWEFAYLNVVESLFFAVTDGAGQFAFPPGMPPGKYTVEARHLKAGVATQEITIERGKQLRLNFTLEVPKR